MASTTTYYTPTPWSERLIEGLPCANPTGVLDPAVGDGSLLLGSAQRFHEAALFGIDVDHEAVAQTRLVLPNATVSRGDALRIRSVANTKVWRSRKMIDTVVINPPFAGSRKIVEVTVFGQDIVCGVAAGHLLVSLSHFVPKQVAAILPRSFFHAERDRKALEVIRKKYDVVRARGLDRATFTEGNAASEIAYFIERGAPDGVTSPTVDRSATDLASCNGESVWLGVQVGLVRGRIPVHLARRAVPGRGVPFVHTRGLTGRCGARLRVAPTGRGIVRGTCILVPRVGYVTRNHLCTRMFPNAVQLSDCVLALCFSTVQDSEAVCCALRERFDELLACWSGTGAPYTTVDKVRRYLECIGVDCVVVSGWPASDACP